jgi:hypothetical protein
VVVGAGSVAQPDKNIAITHHHGARMIQSSADGT